MAAQTLSQTLEGLSADLSARQTVTLLSDALHNALSGHSGEASGVICSLSRREVWSVGDCQFAFLYADGRWEVHTFEKQIDKILASWRSAIVRSYLSRGLMTAAEVAQDDPGRRIIQPFITRQTLYQNDARRTDSLAFGVFDGNFIPDCFIQVIPIPSDVTEVVLASDGYPQLLPTWQETEAALQQMLQDDPLCIDALCGTKGIKPGNVAADDRTYVKFQIPSTHIDDRSKCSSTHPSKP